MIRIHRAIDVASHIHLDQYRKDIDFTIPYISHPFSVSMILLGHGCDEDVIIAGLFHDVKEDRPCGMSLVEQFGENVVSIVGEVSERKFDDDGNKISWSERKFEHSERLRTSSVGSKQVTSADKIHNMRSIILSHERGTHIWDVLNSTPDENISRLHHLFECLREGWCEDELHSLLTEYLSTLKDMERIVRQ